MENLLFKQLLFLLLLLSPLFYLVYRIRGKNVRDTQIFIGIIVLYIIVNYKFVFGLQYVFHDTLWSHHVYYSIIHQWIDNNFAIGWNPFMNGGEPLYLYSNFFLWAEFIFSALLNKVFSTPVNELINLYFTFIFISYFTFSFIFFSLIFKKSSIVFFPTVLLVFSGFTHNAMGQYQICAHFFLPLALCTTYLFLTKREYSYLLWTFFLICVQTNHYLPHYLIIILGIFIVGWYLVHYVQNKTFDFPPIRQLFSKKCLGIFLLSLITILPVATVYFEIGDYISPTRGSAELGEVKTYDGSNGVQVSVSHPVENYRYLLKIEMNRMLKYYHSVYYVGGICIVFLLLSLLYVRKLNSFYYVSLFTLFMMMYLALGTESALWNFMVNYVPMFILRHSFAFAHTIAFFIIFLSTYGFLHTVKQTKYRIMVMVFAPILTIFPVLVANLYKTEKPYEVKPFEYPVERTLISERSSPIPMDTSPIIYKNAVSTHQSEDYMLFRKKEFHALLQKDIMATTGNIFSITNLEKEITPYKIEHLTRNKKKSLPNNSQEDTEGLIHFKDKSPHINHVFIIDKRHWGNSLQISLYGKNASADEQKITGKITYTSDTGIQRREYFGIINTKEWKKHTVRHRIKDETVKIVFSLSHIELESFFNRIEAQINTPYPISIQKADNPNNVVINAHLEDEGYLIRKENLHKGWKAFVNGVETKIEKYNDTFQAVKLPKGDVKVEFVFETFYAKAFWLHFIFVFVGYFFLFARIMREEAYKPETS